VITITFNAFSFLKTRMIEQDIPCGNKKIEIKKDITLHQLIENLGLKKDEVEAVFVNHKVVPKDTIVKDGDRVSLVPPGGIPNHVKVYVG